MSDAQDAIRYRWLMWVGVTYADKDIEPEWADHLLTDFFRGTWVHPDDLNAAIDAAIEAEARYTVTDLGRAYRAVMQQGAKLNGGVKAGEGTNGDE